MMLHEDIGYKTYHIVSLFPGHIVQVRLVYTFYVQKVISSSMKLETTVSKEKHVVSAAAYIGWNVNVTQSYQVSRYLLPKPKTYKFKLTGKCSFLYGKLPIKRRKKSVNVTSA